MTYCKMGGVIYGKIERNLTINQYLIYYILRGCYFRFIDYFRRGRSIDDKSRENVTVISIFYVSDEGETPLVSIIPSRGEDVKDALIAQDLEMQIRKRLNAKLKEAYDLLLEGYTISETAEKLSLTHEGLRLRVKKIRKVANGLLR